MNEKPNTQNNHRSGTLIGFIDLIHELTDINFSGSCDTMTQEAKEDEKDRIIKDIREFDIVTIGDLYLTSGGRIVLDKGYGEYFNKSDKKLFTLEELNSGINPKEFIKKLSFALSEKSE